MGKLDLVKTTIDISDALLARAKRHARRAGKPLRALVEEGLRRVLEEDGKQARYELPDRSVGKPGGPNPLEALSWQDLRDRIYGNG
jgi:Arc/MetJ family transcription regulator